MIIADSQGRMRGSFVIPAGVPAGVKPVRVKGKATEGRATFTGQGTLITDIFQQVTTVTSWWAGTDPLAQTFALELDCRIGGVDLWFAACGSDVRVQVRETQNGFPARTVLADVTVPKNSVRTDGQPTRIAFPFPTALRTGEEYAIVVMCDDALTSVAVAELGKFDSNAQRWVTSQPYTVGTLLSSGNASTWTAHQDRDLTFRLLRAIFSGTSRTVNLGTVTVSNATDLIVFGLSDNPSAGTRLEYILILPNGEELTVSGRQPIRFPSPINGEVQVLAKLYGDAQASPLLFPGTQLVMGTVAESADYYTRSIPATGASKAVLIYDAVIPSGTTVTPLIRKDDGPWSTLTADGTTQQGDGLVEYRFTTPLSAVNEIKAGLTLTGNGAAGPAVRNIRLMAVM
jgi:hypothetical protein